MNSLTFHNFKINIFPVNLYKTKGRKLYEEIKIIQVTTT